MEELKSISFKVLYGLLFVLVIPILLVLWTKHTSGLIKIPVPEKGIFDYILLATGMLLILAGFRDLWYKGKGLPMSPFPPKIFVKNGIFSVLRHPIYTGAILISFGLSLIIRSSSGFWLVSPLFTLGIIAWVIGYEMERTRMIFGPQYYRPFLSLPVRSPAPAGTVDRISAFVFVGLAWVLASVFQKLNSGLPLYGAIDTSQINPLLRGVSLVIYFSGYIVIFCALLTIKENAGLRTFITDIWTAILISGLFYFTIPFFAENRPLISSTNHESNTFLKLILKPGNLLHPYFYLVMVFVSIRHFFFPSRETKQKGWSGLLSLCIIIICCAVAFSEPYITIASSSATYLIVHYRIKIWNVVRNATGNLSNSWKEWRIGPVRIINHGFYGGAAGAAAMLLSGSFLGRGNASAGFIVIILMIICAGLWAQLIEGSPKLLRPFGYYGGAIGVVIGSIVLWFIYRIDIFVTLASFAMAGPWIQAIGRLRCIIQGCCHGKQSDESIGIRFVNPNSRVIKVSGLGGVPLHPTQLYSIACNLVTGLILLRLFSSGMPCTFIIGIYLVLNGIGRFVEEFFRGEAQTVQYAGLRIYQWIAMLNVVAGAVFTTSHYTGTLSFSFNIESVFLALVAGVLTTIASGVDFPESLKRFARLTS